jgi:Holliday junction resolvase
MNNVTQSLYEQKIQSTAQELIDSGYKVSIEPSSLDLPFDLGSYRPDLIATKDNEGLIFEVKTTSNRLSIDRLQSIAEQIATHNGWRFLLITLDDTSESILPLSERDLPSWEELRTRLSSLETLIHDSLFEPSILFLSSILEAALRRRAIDRDIPVWRLPEKNLLNHLFSSGEISISDFDIFKKCLDIRNKVAHGLAASIDINLLNSANMSVENLVIKWST